MVLTVVGKVSSTEIFSVGVVNPALVGAHITGVYST